MKMTVYYCHIQILQDNILGEPIRFKCLRKNGERIVKKNGRARFFVPAFFEEKSKKSFPSTLFAVSAKISGEL
jgi:hypothetical protein